MSAGLSALSSATTPPSTLSMPRASSSKATKRARTAASSSPRQSAAKRTRKKADTDESDSEPVDESSWPQSTILAGQTIAKTKAKEVYRLQDKDLEDLPVVKSSVVRNVKGENREMPMLLYKERDIERAAWRKHGGPEGFKQKLDTLKARHDAARKKDPTKKGFAAPDTYLDQSTDGIRLVTFGPPPTAEERWTSRPELLRLRGNFVPWLWTAVNEHLDRGPDAKYDRGGPGPLASWREDRKTILGRAQKHLHYPARPEAQLGRSPSMDRLREVLDRAPKSVGPLSSEPEGIDSHENHEGNYSAWWSESYLSDLFPALVAVVVEHGVDDDGWRTARWEVYDKYVECIEGVTYIEEEHDSRYNRWADSAIPWLCGRTSRISPACHDRTSDLGTEYNALLPRTDEYGRLR